jgi:polygalacturonase
MTNIVNHQRRTLLRGVSAAGALLAGSACTLPAPAPGGVAGADPWARAAAIKARFATPLAFRDEDFPITAFGARPCRLVAVSATGAHGAGPRERMMPRPGSHDCYPAIRAAIAACHKAGGGRVLIPAGSWYCAGPIVLLSNVHVHLAAGAHLVFSANPAHFALYGDVDCGRHGKLVLSRWQGNDVLNYSPMVYARNQSNIALTGADWTSILDGQASVPYEPGGSCWHDWAGKSKRPGPTAGMINPANPASLAAVAPHLSGAERALIEGDDASWRADHRYPPTLSEAGVPVARRVFGIGHFLRPCMVQFMSCTDVLMQGYQLNDSPFWQHNPFNCRKVHIKNVNMDSLGPNSDGFDPECCDTVLVEGCVFNTGDDCIAIKAGKARDIEAGPTRDVLIQDCVMNSGHGGITLGSEMSAGIEHVYARNIEFRNTHWATDPLSTAIRLKTNMNRGGFVRHFHVRDVTIPNGVQTQPGFYKPLPGSPVAPNTMAAGGGAVITFDCDYAVKYDSVRTRPPAVSDVHISRLRVGNVKTPEGEFSCYQALVLLGPVASSFNGAPGTPILPLVDITLTDCDFGTPRSPTPWAVHNARRVTLTRVRAGGKTVTTTLAA